MRMFRSRGRTVVFSTPTRPWLGKNDHPDKNVDKDEKPVGGFKMKVVRFFIEFKFRRSSVT